MCGESIALHALGRTAESDERLEELRAAGEHWSFQISNVLAYRGDIDGAFEALERAYEIHDSGVPLSKTHPFLRPLRSDPRWPAFLAKIGLAD